MPEGCVRVHVDSAIKMIQSPTGPSMRSKKSISRSTIFNRDLIEMLFCEFCVYIVLSAAQVTLSMEKKYSKTYTEEII